MIHCHELLTILWDEDAHWKQTPAFWSSLLQDVPMFGNVVCVGRHPVTRHLEDLYALYQFANFEVRWCDEKETRHYREVVRKFAAGNRR